MGKHAKPWNRISERRDKRLATETGNGKRKAQ